MVRSKGLMWRPICHDFWIGIGAGAFERSSNREFKQPRRRRQQERHKFAYLTMKNNSFGRFAQTVVIFVHFADVLVLPGCEMTCFAVMWST